ncbi:MAG: CBS domain-containing protein [Nitrososphaeraceae archaeon]
MIRANNSYEQKKKKIKNFYRYSDLSFGVIAKQLHMPLTEVQNIINQMIESDALELAIEKSTTHVAKIMTPDVVALDFSNTAYDAAVLMAEKEVGCIIITKGNGSSRTQKRKQKEHEHLTHPYGIITERDLVRRLSKNKDMFFQDAIVGSICSRPLIVGYPGMTVQEAAERMIKNKIRRLPIVDDLGRRGKENLIGIVTITDLAVFLSPSRRPGISLSILQAISRGRKLNKIFDESFMHYKCRACREWFDSLGDIENHMVVEHLQKGEIP